MDNLLTVELNIIDKKFNDFKLPDELNLFLCSNSKKIRTIVSLLYLKAHNIEITNDIYLILLTGEVIHNASLLHDDVIDDADLRRGEITIAKLFNNHLSILFGDLLLTTATEEILKLKNFEIFENFNTCIKKMCEAEILQYSLRGQKYEYDKYIEICKGKTAYLFMTILNSCAILSNIDKIKAQQFGEQFGILFQLKNDEEIYSKQLDKKNKIFTSDDIIGVEKTKVLRDNYKQGALFLIKDLPNNIYKKKLEDIINGLC